MTNPNLTGLIAATRSARDAFASINFDAPDPEGERMARENDAPALCLDPKCGEPLADHIGGKSCVVGTRSTATRLHHLPIAGWAWREDGRDRRS